MKPQVKRQHHVWRRYFLPWANDKKLYAYIDKKVCRPNAINISVKSLFGNSLKCDSSSGCGRQSRE
ncbi:hypothetical protein, partial [Acetobacter orleanensis]|uniref:hypothetical protein n=1 Tax=Acetobacter orleanensis TaxID=104099 RepID=UPI002231D1EF